MISQNCWIPTEVSRYLGAHPFKKSGERLKGMTFKSVFYLQGLPKDSQEPSCVAWNSLGTVVDPESYLPNFKAFFVILL